MTRSGEAGQAAVEAIAGAAALLALTVLALNVVGLLAAAGALQAQTREAAVREAMEPSGASVVTRSIRVAGVIPGGEATRLTARATIRDPSE